MNNEVFAVLLDVTSIQKYIFASNKLKDNLGASYLIEEIYNSFLKKAYKKVLNIDINIDDWKSKDLKLPESPIAYIGGGNTLVFFETNEKAIDFIKEWTKLLLVKAPACNPISACDSFDLSDFKNSKKKIFQKLRENKASYSYSTIIPRHGITTECTRTGLSAEEWNNEDAEQKKSSYISMVSRAKIKAAKESKDKYKKFISKYPNVKFTDKLDKLGQKEQEKNHIAIVHIDGNDIGEKFRKTKTLEEIRTLSKKITEITQQAFQGLIDYIMKNIEELSKEFDIKNDNTYTLPIRPIIIGGDDITFVCAGKLGIIFAKVFLEEFEKAGKEKGESVTACAGVSIIKSKSPFFRGYSIAEELCTNAKNIRKKDKRSESLLDFNIASGGLFGTLDEIRENHFKVPCGSLIFRPYSVSKEKDLRNYDSLIEGTSKLKKCFPSSKIKELREVMTLGKDSIKNFIEREKYRGNYLPKIDSKHYENEVFQDNETPYFDMIEIIEFYPQFLLKRD